MKLYDKKQFIKEVDQLVKQRIIESPIVDINHYRRVNLSNSKTILIIEKNREMKFSIKRILEEDGYMVIAINDTTQLGSLAHVLDFDIILLDVDLPWVSGFEFVKIMKTYKSLRNIPVIFLSEKREKELLQKAFDLGVDQFLSKPFEVEEIKKTVRILLKIQKEFNN